MPHASPSLAAAAVDVTAAGKTSTQSAVDSIVGWINSSDSAAATAQSTADTATSDHAATKAAVKAFFEALQTALPIIQARLEPLDGSLDDLITATDTVVVVLS